MTNGTSAYTIAPLFFGDCDDSDNLDGPVLSEPPVLFLCQAAVVNRSNGTEYPISTAFPPPSSGRPKLPADGMAVNVDDARGVRNLQPWNINLIHTVSFPLGVSWINCTLFILEIFWMSRYFQLPSKPLLQRISVGAILASDTVYTFAICASVYLVVVVMSCQPYELFVRSSMQVQYCVMQAPARRVTGPARIHLYVGDFDSGLQFSNRIIGWPLLSSKTFTFIRFEKTLVVQIPTRRQSWYVSSSESHLAQSKFVAYSLFFRTQGWVHTLTILGELPGGRLEPVDGDVTNNPRGSIITAVVFHNDGDSAVDDRVSITNGLPKAQRTQGLEFGELDDVHNRILFPPSRSKSPADLDCN
ncbi:hypothetical protein C8R45DRAFT_933190 [Mycena sanguinolenta]|nr:hypothetical protein C8R45DRAFT_933190 [Mycena sanguinolenta]